MARKVDTKEFIRMAKLKHGEKYDYSNVIYTRGKDNIIIKCLKHGEFIQRASTHLQGSGCPECFHERNLGKSLICGVGVNDVGQTNLHLFTTWRGMLFRCYDKRYNKAYNACTVCEEWKRLSLFKTWYDANYVEGWQLDKDILSNGVKEYSPNTCCFVPGEINMCIVGYGSKGITFVKGAWQASFSQKYIGRFKSKEDAIAAYSQTKANHIKGLVKKYADKLPQKVIDALNQHAIRLCGLNELADNFNV